MKPKILPMALFVITVGIVVLQASRQSAAGAAGTSQTLPGSASRIEVVFALDTTSSMSGLIDAAKQNIWSIARSMTQSGQQPEIHMGLVAFRDVGDDYVTRVVDLSTDLDSVYTELMGLTAAGGGDGPESVNAALNAAINEISWSQDPNIYRVVFLVGDAPPHMDYPGKRRYPAILGDAARRGIVVNTIQCGDLADTVQPWTQIAALGKGRYLHVEQTGSAVAIDTPFDREIATLAAELDETRLIYGTADERAARSAEIKALNSALAGTSDATRARRGVFQAGAAGTRNEFGGHDLVAEIESGRLRLDTLSADQLPATISSLPKEEQSRTITEAIETRERLRQRIDELAQKRDAFLDAAVETRDLPASESLDGLIYDVVREQAGDHGIDYTEGPKF